MAEVQESGPLADYNFEDDTWRARFGAETGITGDRNGSAFGLTLPPASDDVEIGSPTIDSTASVAGFSIEIPAGTTQSLNIPASSNGGAGRTDLIVARLDLSSYTTPPGPVRLYRIPGVEGSAARPSYTTSTTGTWDMPLYAITRKFGEALTTAGVVDLRWRIVGHYLVNPQGSMPANAPLGSTATRAEIRYRRDMVGSSPQWVEVSRPRQVIEGITAVALPGEGFSRRNGSRMVRDGKSRDFTYVVWKGFPARNPNPAMDGSLWVGTLHDQDKPISPDQQPLTGWAIDEGGTTRAAIGFVAPNGQIWWSWASANSMFGADGRDKTLVLHGSWEVA